MVLWRTRNIVGHLYADIAPMVVERQVKKKYTIRLKTVFILKLVLTTAEHRFCYTKLQVNIERTLTKCVGPAVNEENQRTDDLYKYS